MTKPDLDELKIVNLDSGDEFTSWESASVTSDFLTPCDAFKVEAGSDEKTIDIARRLAPGARVQVLVNGHPQLTGRVDNATLTNGRNGRKVSITGRDTLSLAVDSNVDPRMSLSKDVTIDQLCEKVLKQQLGFELTIFPYNERIESALGQPVGAKRMSYAGGKHKRKDPLKDITPHDNEGAFSYLSRILTHHGYWLWSTCDGEGVVVAGPEYNQPSSGALVSKYDPAGTGLGKANNVLEATFNLHGEGIPALVQVRGQSSGAGTKGAILGAAQTKYASQPTVVYISDKDATSKEKAERIARMFLARQMRNYLVYECTLAGFKNRTGGGVYQVDTLLDVDDEALGLKGQMWVESRTFEKSRSNGTTTKLKLIPPGTLVLDYQPDEQIPAVRGPGAPTLVALNPFAGGRYDVDDVSFFLAS